MSDEQIPPVPDPAPAAAPDPAPPAAPIPASAPGTPTALSDSEVQSKKLLVGILAIVLGWLGVHKFILGYTTPGIIMVAVGAGGLVLSPCTFGLTGLATTAVWVIGLVEGIIYLTKTNEDFRRTYLDGKKEWF